MKKENYLDYEKYPEYQLNGRVALAIKWLPKECQNILDGGCAFGYATRFFAKHSKKVTGIDPNNEFVDIAKKRYPELKFKKAGLEKIPCQDEEFDCVVINDVLEHVEDEEASLNEIYRVLKKGGSLIITTPHKGLFGFLDPDNYFYYFRKYFPKTYNKINIIRNKKIAKDRPGYVDKHKHYSLKDFHRMLQKSTFKKRYKITNKFRSGLLVGPLTMNIELFLRLFLSKKNTNIIIKPFRYISKKEYWIPFGFASFNIAIKLIKK